MNSKNNFIENAKEPIFKDYFSRLVKVSDEVVKSIIGAPDDYLIYLKEVGWGAVGNNTFMIYSGPLTAIDIFGEGNLLEHLIFFGDDFQGYSYAFNPDGCVIEVEPNNLEQELVANTFEEFIMAKAERFNESKRAKANAMPSSV